MSANEYGQGKSHTTGDSAVPKKVQEAAPAGLEEALPDKVCHKCPPTTSPVAEEGWDELGCVLGIVNGVNAVIGPPHRRQRIPVHLQDARPQRRRGLDRPQEDPGDPARERRARGAECYSQHWRQACDEVERCLASDWKYRSL
jgi:hypothetical protein